MKSTVGVFDSFFAARGAGETLMRVGFDPQQIALLAPGSPQSAWDGVPTSGTEQSGMGEAVFGVVGGAVGAAAGLPLGVALATLLVPGVGPVLAMGIAGAAILGVGGAAVGAAAGKGIENRLFTGVPEDEVYFYEDALRRGHAVVVAFTPDDKTQEMAERLLREAGAESLDAARESWWIGLRSAELEHYKSSQEFHHDEKTYRRGFEAALRPAMRGIPYEDALNDLRRQDPDATELCFRRGYERGQVHYQALTSRTSSTSGL